MKFLACDLGGTKVLLGIYEKTNISESPKLIIKEKYLSSEWDSIESILENFLNKYSLKTYSFETACFAVAGPINNNTANITNLPWKISEEDIKDKFKFKKLELINDFAVLIYGIPFLNKNQYETIQKGVYFEGNNNNLHSIVGAGTGLGISRGIINSEKIQVLASEGGHIEFAPRTSNEWELKEWLKIFLNLDRVSCERIISGEGLCNIARWRFSKPDVKNHAFQKFLKESEFPDRAKNNLAQKICKLSDQGDTLMMEIESIWLNAYASLLGDIAIYELCFGGLWISGGTASKHFKNFRSDSFLKHFSNKGRYKDILKSIPVKVILDEEFGLFSAACRAKMLLKNHNLKNDDS